jgi:hypothetical protein
MLHATGDQSRDHLARNLGRIEFDCALRARVEPNDRKNDRTGDGRLTEGFFNRKLSFVCHFGTFSGLGVAPIASPYHIYSEKDANGEILDIPFVGARNSLILNGNSRPSDGAADPREWHEN